MKKYLSISTVIFALFSLMFISTLNFGGVIGFALAAAFMMPITQDFLARKTGRDNIPLLARGFFATVAFIVASLFIIAFEASKPMDNNTSEYPASTNQTAPPIKPDPTSVPTPVQTPKSTSTPEVLVTVKTLFATKPSDLEKLLGKPTSTGTIKMNEYGCDLGCDNRQYSHAGLVYELIVSKKENRVNSSVIEPGEPEMGSKAILEQLLAGASQVDERTYTMPGVDTITTFQDGDGFESIFARIEY